MKYVNLIFMEVKILEKRKKEKTKLFSKFGNKMIQNIENASKLTIEKDNKIFETIQKVNEQRIIVEANHKQNKLYSLYKHDLKLVLKNLESTFLKEKQEQDKFSHNWLCLIYLVLHFDSLFIMLKVR